MRIFVVASVTGVHFSLLKIGDELRRRGHEVRFLVCSRMMAEAAEDRGHWVRNCNFEMKRELGGVPFDLSRFEALVTKYRVEFERIAFGQWLRFGNSRRYAQELVFRYLLYCEPLFESFRPDLVVLIDRHPLDIIAWSLASAQGIPTLISDGISVVPGAHWWGSPNFYDWVHAEQMANPLSEAERREVYGYVNQCQQKKPIIAIERFAGSIISMRRLRNVLTYSYYYLRDRPYNRSMYSPFRYVTGHLMFHVLLPLKRRYYQPVVPNERFFLFPLHVMDDFATSYNAIDLWRQDHLVEQIAQVMPPGYKLYVKEHPHPKWPLPLGWIRDMASLPNVRVIPPRTNVYDLIPHADGVMVISSKAGWDALACYRPVIAFKRAFYANRGVTVDVSDVSRVGEALQFILENSFPDREKVDRLVYAVLRSVYPGTFGHDTEDAPLIADAVLAEYARRARSGV
jgi:hypothetical protein